jgi:hypothetical protein
MEVRIQGSTQRSRLKWSELIELIENKDWKVLIKDQVRSFLLLRYSGNQSSYIAKNVTKGTAKGAHRGSSSDSQSLLDTVL